MSLTLSIETGVEGGSLALFKQKSFLGGLSATEKISSAERVLVDLKHLLANYELQKNEITKIVLSNGPGSATGLRIGEAIAMGLKTTLRCDLIIVSVLEAMMIISQDGNSEERQQFGQIAAVPFGRNQIASLHLPNHIIVNTENGLAKRKLIGTYEEFFESICKVKTNTRIILHDKLHTQFAAELRSMFAFDNKIINVGTNLALVNGLKTLV